jgi:hypothetical protein
MRREGGCGCLRSSPNVQDDRVLMPSLLHPTALSKRIIYDVLSDVDWQ